MLSNEPFQKQSVVLCEIAFPGVPVQLPALMRVRWTSVQNVADEFHLSGLQFVY